VFEETENVPKRFSTTAHRKIGGTVEGERLMKKTLGGVCICLKDGRCSIYDKRPSSCRDFEIDSVECLELFERSKCQVSD
jgi:Fe-S-cluster containining protein